MNDGGCEQKCHNSEGSFSCSCNDGYAIAANGFDCTGIKIIDYNYHETFYLCLISLDKNECSEGTDTCSHICVNTVGSYKCSCPTGYQLDSDARTCVGKYNYWDQNNYLKI